jgi:hypothetical protein
VPIDPCIDARGEVWLRRGESLVHDTENAVWRGFIRKEFSERISLSREGVIAGQHAMPPPHLNRSI